MYIHAVLATSKIIQMHLFEKTMFSPRLSSVAVCTGTQNSLSMTGNSDVQYNIMKEMYTGCEIVMGNLEITHMEQNRNFSFLQVRGGLHDRPLNVGIGDITIAHQSQCLDERHTAKNSLLIVVIHIFHLQILAVIQNLLPHPQELHIAADLMLTSSEGPLGRLLCSAAQCVIAGDHSSSC